MERQGILPRIVEGWRSLTGRGKSTNNIFIPTATLQLFSHLNKILPNHHVIMADFDSFIMPKVCVSGINAPIVTNKLSKPSEWETYDTYLVPRGTADICFPTNFHFLKHAYHKLTGKNPRILKNYEMFDEFALKGWWETKNGFNPMREEYVNTSFLIS